MPAGVTDAAKYPGCTEPLWHAQHVGAPEEGCTNPQGQFSHLVKLLSASSMVPAGQLLQVEDS